MSVKKEQIATLIKKGASFTTLDNRAIFTIGKADALAIWVYLAAKPPNWKVIPADVQKSLTIGRRRYHDGMRRLRELGLVMDRFVHEGGVITSRFIIVTNMLPDLKVPEPVSKDDALNIPVMYIKQKCTVNETGNLLIKKESNKKEREVIINKHIPGCAPLPSFDDFWSQWPKKVAKDDALKAWTKVKPDQQAFDSIIANLQSHANAGDWNITRYIPNPGKYLRQKLWQDTVYPAQEERQKSLSEKISEATSNPTDWAKNGTFGNKFNSSLIS